MTSVNGVAYTYDANGNQLSDGARTFTYDSANRLKQVVSGTLTTQYAYSGDGVRRAQVVNGVQTRYLVDVAAPLPQVLQETKQGATTRYLYGLGLIGTQDSGTWAYQHPDGLGSVRQVSNSAGQIVLAQSFTPFGAAKTAVGSAPGSFGFAGEQQDAAADLIFLRARYYDPTTGRFLTRDPYPAYASTPGTLHRYAYSRNDPVNLVDPSGLDPDRVGGNNFITRMLSEGVRNTLCNIGGALGDLMQWLQSPEAGAAALVASGVILAGSIAAIIMTGGAAAIPMAVGLGALVGGVAGGVGQFVQDLSTGHWSSIGTYAQQIGIGALGGAVAGVIGLAGTALGCR